MQVVEKMQSGNKSKRDSWRSELPREGLGGTVIEKLKEEKSNDVVWQGKCSGTVYVAITTLHINCALVLRWFSAPPECSKLLCFFLCFFFFFQLHWRE